MGFVTKLFTGILGGDAPKANIEPAVDAVADDKKKVKKTRVSLAATAGGMTGDEVATGGTSQRSTIFGN